MPLGPPVVQRWVSAAILSVVVAASLTACEVPKPVETNEYPSSGVLFFHRYTEYGAWDASLFELDLTSRRVSNISASWAQVTSPINAHPNAAGQEITFMASTSGLPDYEWDVFVSRWDGTRWSEPVNLTGPNGKRDEDPKFGPDGHTIVFKEDGVLATIQDTGMRKQLLTVGEPESSMPYFTPDGAGIIFERNGSILLLQDGKESIVWKASGTRAYYPIGVDSRHFLFTEVQASHHDRTVWGSYSGAAPVPLFTSSNDCDNSDPYPYGDGSRFVFYVTTCPVVADRTTHTVHDLDLINSNTNSHDQELGPAWSGTAPFPREG